MKPSRRHESIIPLSREHQYGLLECLRIHRGIEGHRTDVSRLSERAEKVIRFFESDLKKHFKAEERVLFPCYELGVSPEQASQAGIRIQEVIGTARLPKNPALLEWSPLRLRLLILQPR